MFGNSNSRKLPPLDLLFQKYNNICIKDDADNCYKYDQEKVDCEKNRDKIKSFPIQHLSTEKEIEAPKFLGLF